MPGLIVVAESEGAEAVARRAARPLLRRPWEAVSLLASADGRVALGFAGERGAVVSDEQTGCIAALDGELFGPVRTGGAAARELLGLYLQDGEALAPPQGCFALAVFDPRRERLVLVTDRYAGRPVYVAERGATLLATGELKALVAAGVEPALDSQGAAEVLAYRHTLSGRTLLAGARMLPGATTLVSDAEGRRETQRWRYRLRQDENAGEEPELVAELGRLLERSLGSRLDGSEVLALSGGIDSRCVASVLAARGFRGLSATFGVLESRDLRLGEAVARAAGLRHRRLLLDRGHVARDGARCVWLADTRRRCIRSHELVFPPLRHEEGARALVTSNHGDDAARLEEPPDAGRDDQAFVAALHARRAHAVSDRLHETVLAPSFAGELRGRARTALAESVARDEGDRTALLAQLRFRNGSSSGLYDDHLAFRDPFTDDELVDFLAGLPYELRLNGHLQRSYLRQHPDLAGLASTMEGFAPARSGAAERAARVAVSLRRRGRIAADRVIPARLWLGGRVYHWYGSDLAAAGAPLLGILLEPRTLARGQIRERPVKRMVDETLRGRRAFVLALDSLLTIELFQRQFIDGDGAPDPL